MPGPKKVHLSPAQLRAQSRIEKILRQEPDKLDALLESNDVTRRKWGLGETDTIFSLDDLEREVPRPNDLRLLN